jgi:hypothetical protein
VIERLTPRAGVDGYQIGDRSRLVELPNPIPAQRINQDDVEEYLTARGLDVDDFRAFLDTSAGGR